MSESFVQLDAQKVMDACNLGLEKINNSRTDDRNKMIEEWLVCHPRHWFTRRPYTREDAINSLSESSIWSDYHTVELKDWLTESVLEQLKNIAEVSLKSNNNIVNVSRYDFSHLKRYYKT